MPVRSNGRYHLPGPIRVIDEGGMANLLNIVKPVFTGLTGVPVVVIPPLPRYLKSGCCPDPAHCTNRSGSGFAEDMLAGITRCRNQIKNTLLGWGLSRFWVLDSLAALAGTLEASRPSNRDMVPALQKQFTADSVHLTSSGQKNLCAGIALATKKLASSKTDSCLSDCVSGGGAKKFYWRGFISPVGSSLRGSSSGSGSAAHSRQRGLNRRGGSRPHPYRKKN